MVQFQLYQSNYKPEHVKPNQYATLNQFVLDEIQFSLWIEAYLCFSLLIWFLCPRFGPTCSSLILANSQAPAD